MKPCKPTASLAACSCEKDSRLFFRGHPFFQVHAECIGDAVDVVEIGDHLHGVVNGRAGKSLRAQQIEIFWRYLGGPQSELLRKLEQRLGRLAESGVPPVVFDFLR